MHFEEKKQRDARKTKRNTNICYGAFYNTLQLSSSQKFNDGCSLSWWAVTNMIMVCLPCVASGVMQKVTVWYISTHSASWEHPHEHSSPATCTIITSHFGSQILEKAHARKQLPCPILPPVGWGPEEASAPQAGQGNFKSGLCLSPHLQWILCKASPWSLHISTDFRHQGGHRHGWDKLPPPGKVRRIQLYMGKCYLESNKRLVTSVGGPLLPGGSGMLGLHSPSLRPFHSSSAPSTRHAKAIKAHSHLHPFTRSLYLPRASLAHSCCALISAGAFGFPDFSSIWHLPAAAAATRVVAASCISCHPDLSAGHGEAHHWHQFCV